MNTPEVLRLVLDEGLALKPVSMSIQVVNMSNSLITIMLMLRGQNENLIF